MVSGTSRTALDMNTRFRPRGYQGADPRTTPDGSLCSARPFCVTTSGSSYIHGSGPSKSSAPLQDQRLGQHDANIAADDLRPDGLASFRYLEMEFDDHPRSQSAAGLNKHAARRHIQHPHRVARPDAANQAVRQCVQRDARGPPPFARRGHRENHVRLRAL